MGKCVELARCTGPHLLGWAFYWDHAQVGLQNNRRNTRPRKSRYLLRGLIRCECGATYCGYSPRREGGPTNYRYLARHNYRRLSRPEPCSSLTVRAAEL